MNGPSLMGGVALQHEFGQQYFEVGSYGVHADRYPGGVSTAGTDKITDVAFDANYQWHSDDAHWLGRPVDNFISAHSTLIDEHADLTANQCAEWNQFFRRSPYFPRRCVLQP